MKYDYKSNVLEGIGREDNRRKGITSSAKNNVQKRVKSPFWENEINQSEKVPRTEAKRKKYYGKERKAEIRK